MCKVLFFDTESGNSHTASMCSFGYVLTDEKFNIIEQDDIFMNPNKKWEKRVLEDVLFFPKEHYESFPQFNVHYERIKKLFGEDVIVFGHAIANDVMALNHACERYNLPYIDFKYYISDHIYKEFAGDKNKNDISLDRISEKMGLERQNERHTSLQDATIVMKQVERMCELLEMSIIDIISVVDYCNGENKDGKWINERKPISFQTKHNLLKGHNNRIFTNYLETVEIEHNKKSKYNNKIVSISSNFELFNFKEMMLIVKLLGKNGGYYNRKASLSDYYIVCDSEIQDNKIKYVEEAIENGKKIKKIKLEEFLLEIGYNSEDVENNYSDYMKHKSKTKKKRHDKSSFTFGDLLKEKNLKVDDFLN